jgi:hypothetical protein
MWAFIYNIFLIPIAMGFLFIINGFRLHPMLAGIAMALSSISVVCSSLFIRCFRPFTIEQEEALKQEGGKYNEVLDHSLTSAKKLKSKRSQLMDSFSQEI